MKTMANRKAELAEFGEIRAYNLLRQNGFVLERMSPNFHFFDLMATRGSCRLLVPVKTRNNTTSKGKPKINPYNLYPKLGHYEAAMKIANFAGAKIFWVAVTVDAKAQTFSAYMGDVGKLPSYKRIPMHPTNDLFKYNCLAKDEYDPGNQRAWSKVVGTVSG
jgi:hypothetical protein